MPWPDVAAMVHQIREDRIGALAQAGQSMGWNHPERPRPMDSNCLEKGVWVSHQRRRHGDVSGKVRRKEVRQPASPQGRIRITGMHGSESKAGAGVLGSYSLSKEANKGDGHHWEHYLWRLHWREKGDKVIFIKMRQNAVSFSEIPKF